MQISRVSELLEYRRAAAGRASEQETELSNARIDAQEKQDRLRALQVRGGRMTSRRGEGRVEGKEDSR
jgi:hypothetical protein